MNKTASLETDDKRSWRFALIVVGVLTLIRVLILVIGRLELHPDESQYWWWAQTPAFGYFSKPPMVAWVIWLTTSLFGDSEWAVRLGSPLLHAGTAMLLFGIGRLAYDVRAGLWSAIVYATLPGVSFSSCLISTDVPLLFFWALALYALLRALDDPGWTWALLCGLGIGGGLLSKYAMFFFVLSAVLAALLVPKVRALVLSVRGLGILTIGLLALSPNIAWNAMHGFPTVVHTEVNADWDHAHYNVMNALDFLVGQFGVFGPLMMAGLLAVIWRLARGPERGASDLTLVAFTLPPLAAMIGQAFISEANANWAATAYIAATPLVVRAVLVLWRARALWVSVALHTIAMLCLWAVVISPSLADTVGLGNAFKRMEGWHELGQAVLEETQRARYDAVAFANRSVIAEMVYYARPWSIPARMWDKDTHDHDHFQMTMRLTTDTPHVLLAISPDEAGVVLPTFGSERLIRTIVIPIAGHHPRIIVLYDARDYRGPQAH